MPSTCRRGATCASADNASSLPSRWVRTGNSNTHCNRKIASQEYPGKSSKSVSPPFKGQNTAFAKRREYPLHSGRILHKSSRFPQPEALYDKVT